MMRWRRIAVVVALIGFTVGIILANRTRKASGAVAQPSAPQEYLDLAATYMTQARATGDFSLNARAQAAVQHVLERAPDDTDARMLETGLLLAYHRFGDALIAARRLQEVRPDDPVIYGFLTDALVELGQYGDAVTAAQKMMDVRPDGPAYARVSHLRALHGDTGGAIAAMRLAVQSATNAEALAWYRVHLGLLLLADGRPRTAERELDRALATLPGYYLALTAKARTRLAAGDTEGAVLLLQTAQNRVPLPDTVIALGDLYTKLGRTAEARRQYDLLEFIERAATPGTETYSQHLALFWSNHDLRLDEALAMAQRERAARADVQTYDVLAWCLFKKGDLAAASSAMNEALRLGTRDARFFYHAGMIARGRGEQAAARRYLTLALEVNPTFDVLQSDIARRVLIELNSNEGGEHGHV